MKAIGFMLELDDGPRHTAGGFKTVVRAALGCVAKTQSVLHENDRLTDFAQRQRDAVHTANGERLGNVTGQARRTRVLVAGHQVELDAARVLETLAHFTETRHHLLVEGDAFGGETIPPEIQGAFRNGIVDDPDLPRPRPRLHPPLPEGKRGHQGTHVPLGVAVIQVVDGFIAVEQDCLLDQALPQQFHVEVHILLRAGNADGQMVKAFYQ
ncbi:hypothetical protein D9M73_177740 [compost metagenome]